MRNAKTLLFLFIFSGLFMAGFNTLWNNHEGQPFVFSQFVIQFFSYGAIFTLINYFTSRKTYKN